MPQALAVKRRDVHAMLSKLAIRAHRPIIVMLYPNKLEEENGSRCGYETPRLLRVADVRLFCVKAARNWNVSLYRDTIHPFPAGMRLLARLIAVELANTRDVKADHRAPQTGQDSRSLKQADRGGFRVPHEVASGI